MFNIQKLVIVVVFIFILIIIFLSRNKLNKTVSEEMKEVNHSKKNSTLLTYNIKYELDDLKKQDQNKVLLNLIEKNKYDFIHLQEYTGFDQIKNSNIIKNNYSYKISVSGKEKMTTLFDKNKYQEIKSSLSQFRRGRPFHVILLQCISNLKYILLINVHFPHKKNGFNDKHPDGTKKNFNFNEVQNIINREINKNIYESVISKLQIIVAGDFNIHNQKDFNITFGEKTYELKNSDENKKETHVNGSNIDHIFLFPYRKNITQILSQFTISDHKPVEIKII